MIFGEGVFGPEGVFLCCAGFVVIPALYLSVASATAFSVPLRNNAVAALNVVVAFVVLGYLFGDIVGGVVAFFIALGSFSTTAIGPRRTIHRIRRIRVVRDLGGNFPGTIFQDDDAAAYPGEKRKRDNDDPPIIIERPPEQ